MSDPKHQALRKDPDSDGDDYILEDSSCWITVGNISVWVRKNDEAVIVELLPHFHEGGEKCFDSAIALFSEAEEFINKGEEK